MSGAMVPRGAGEERLVHQQRKLDLAEHVKAVKSLTVDYTQRREAIREHLWAVYSQHLYMETHDAFADWFDDQKFELGLRTAKRMIAESRPVKTKLGTRVPSSNQKGGTSPPKKAKPEPDAPLDDFGTPIPPGNCRDTWGDKFIQDFIDTLDQMTKTLLDKEFKKGLEKRAKRLPFYNAPLELNRIQSIVHDMDTLADSLRDNRPAGVCPSCAGKGCLDCHHAGMVPTKVHERLRKTQ